MKIRWHGHSCFEISNDVTLVTDPHDGRSIGIKPPQVKADVVLISHDHYDHNCSRVVEKEGTIVITSAREKRRTRGIEIRSLKSFHDKFGGKKRGENEMFIFSMEGMNFCHLGDLGHLLDDSIVEEIGKIDVLFIPIGGTFTIDAKDAMKVCEKITTKVIIPMHYKIGGLSLPIEGIDEFLDLAKKGYGLSHMANEVDMEREDLPEETEIWIFTL